jgi:Tryptophan/tyrosine permease family
VQVYHDLIPVVVTLLRGDRNLVQRALLLGSALPLAMFLGWNMVALAQPPLLEAMDPAGRWDPVQQMMESGGLAVGGAVACFSVLAITTSFLGASLGVAISSLCDSDLREGVLATTQCRHPRKRFLLTGFLSHSFLRVPCMRTF